MDSQNRFETILAFEANSHIDTVVNRTVLPKKDCDQFRSADLHFRFVLFG